MTIGYWLKGEKCIRIGEEPHGSAIARQPILFGVDPDAVTFALDEESGIGDLVAFALHNGWIKVRRYFHEQREHWDIAFADFARSRVVILQFVESAFRESDRPPDLVSVALEGVEDGFRRETEVAPTDLPSAFADGVEAEPEDDNQWLLGGRRARGRTRRVEL